MSLSVRQTSYHLVCEVVRAALIDAVESGPGAVGLVQHRAMAALYKVLLDHPVDRRGRCRSCRRPGAVLGRRRRRCRVHIETTYWLHQPDEEFLRSQLAGEFGLADPPPSGLNTAPKRRGTDAGAADDRDDTVVLPAVDSLPSNGSIAVPQSPTVSPPPSLPGGFPRAGRPDPDHGAAREPTPTDPGRAVAHPTITSLPSGAGHCCSPEVERAWHESP